MKYTGARIVIECLVEQGVDMVFGYPGGAILNVYDELYNYQDKIIKKDCTDIEYNKILNMNLSGIRTELTFVRKNNYNDILKEIYKPNGYSIMQNGGEFNDVGHYHLHIFPRYIGDGFGWTYGEDAKNVNAEIAKRIRDRIN